MKYVTSVFTLLLFLGVVINAIVGEWMNVLGGLVLGGALLALLMWQES